jgi:hypothetical protein
VADNGDEEKETLVLWTDEGNSENNKKDGAENTKNTQVHPKLRDIQLPMSHINVVLSSKSEQCRQHKPA